jgi:hypothetical protein
MQIAHLIMIKYIAYHIHLVSEGKIMYPKGIVALVLALVFFVPGAYGISVIMSGEEGGNQFL